MRALQTSVRTRVRLLGALGAALLLAAAPPDSPVADAAMRGDAEAVRALVKQGADVNAPQGDGMTALHWVAVNGDGELARLLIEAGANLRAVTRNGAYTPLHLAGRGGHASVVRALLEGGSDPDARTGTAAATPLHLAAASGSADAVRALLDAGAEVDARESEWEQTPLVFAAALDRIAVMEALIDAGANVSHTTRVVDLEAQAAVDAEARKAYDQVIAVLAARADAKPTPTQVQAAVRAAQRIQLTMVNADPQQDRPLEDGEVQLAVSTQGGMTPLLHAVRQGHASAARLLLDSGADLEQAKAGDETTPLLMSIINGHYDLALELLGRGADPNRSASDGATPLFSVLNNYWAPMSRYPQQHAYMRQQASYLDVMKALLDAGADPNARLGRVPWFTLYTFGSLGVNLATATPFWRAAHATDVEAMRLLVAYGADPNLPTLAVGGGGGRGAGPAAAAGAPGAQPLRPAVWPIHVAAGAGYAQGYTANFHRHSPGGWMPAIRYLVEELGADVHTLDSSGYNAIHHAASRGDNEMILYLVSKGVDPKAVAANGRTTVDMANGPGQRITPFPATIALLESLGAVNNHRCVSC
jgi:ankyrin repeat protein